jgi:hypothetical protein
MWGTWSVVTFGFAGVVMLVLALALAASPLFAVAIVLVALAIVSFFMAGRRQRTDPESPDQAKARSEAILARGTDAETAGTRPSRTGGAPASGEGT